MTETVKMQGFEALGRAFDQLPKATAANVGRRVLKKAGQPVYDHFHAIAPRGTEDQRHMADSGGVSTKLIRRQRKKRNRSHDRDFAEMYIGPGRHVSAVQQEFGNINHPAQPSLTPAWEANKRGVLNTINRELWGEIKKAADRLARKLARARA